MKTSSHFLILVCLGSSFSVNLNLFPSRSIPERVLPGGSIPIAVTIRNTEQTRWDNVQLQASHATLNFTFNTNAGVSPGQTTTISGYLPARPLLGRYRFTFTVLGICLFFHILSIKPMEWQKVHWLKM